MSNKVVWSSNGELEYLASLDPENLKATLIDYGYDQELLDQLTPEEVRDILDTDADNFWQKDIEDFDFNVEPMINKQTCDGIVLMAGDAETWTGKHQAGKAVFTEDLKGGDLFSDVDNIEIISDDGDLVWLGHHHDGTHRMKLYALPEDNQVDFIRNCMEDAIEDELAWNHEGEDYEDAEDDILENILGQFTDLDYLNDYINWSQVPNYCTPIKNLFNESLNESSEDIVTIYVDAVDGSNLDVIRDEFGLDYEFIKDAIYDNLKLTGTKADIVDYLKSNNYGVDDAWIEEFYPELFENLNEAASKEPKKLAKELREIKKLSNEYGREYFTVMPFTSYDNDPDSIEMRYPEFFRVVKSFFKEMEIADKDQLQDNDYLDMLWDTDISQHDWDTLLAVCDKLIELKKPIQIEKIYKNNFEDGLNDDQILADREGNPDFTEEN